MDSKPVPHKQNLFLSKVTRNRSTFPPCLVPVQDEKGHLATFLQAFQERQFQKRRDKQIQIPAPQRAMLQVHTSEARHNLEHLHNNCRSQRSPKTVQTEVLRGKKDADRYCTHDADCLWSQKTPKRERSCRYISVKIFFFYCHIKYIYIYIYVYISCLGELAHNPPFAQNGASPHPTWKSTHAPRQF